MTKLLDEFQERIGYQFRRNNLLIQALTHSSIKDERHPSNERLEFLGDAVLGLVITEYVYKKFPEHDEGDLTVIKSIVVSHTSLLKIAKSLNLKKYISVGKGISKRRTIPSSLMANAVEAFIGAIYLDGGYRASRRFVLEHAEPMVEKVLKKRTVTNFKSLLQSYVQKKFGSTPHYRLITEGGPDHKKIFELAAVVDTREFPPGKGKSKKIASLQAARNALTILQDE